MVVAEEAEREAPHLPGSVEPSDLDKNARVPRRLDTHHINKHETICRREQVTSSAVSPMTPECQVTQGRDGADTYIYIYLRGALVISSDQSSSDKEMQSSELPTATRVILQPDPKSTNLILTTLPVPVPKPNSNEHLIRVHAAALTNGELLWLTNYALPAEITATRQPVPCYDMAATVISAPADSPFQPGAKVYARTDYLRAGCARDYAIATTSELARKPERLSWPEAATVPMSAETAWQALFVQAGLDPRVGGAAGQRIFVTAASGSAGAWIVQLAKWAGAYVIGTSSGRNIDYVRSLGASEVLDYHTVDIQKWATEETGRECDLVIDCIGGKSLQDAWWVVKDGGSLISIFQPPEEMKPEGLPKKSVKNWFFIMEARGDQLGTVTEMIDQGLFQATLDSVYPFEQFQEAVKKLEAGNTRGKVVLDLTA